MGLLQEPAPYSLAQLEQSGQGMPERDLNSSV